MADAGDFAAALATADALPGCSAQPDAMAAVAEAQVRAGDEAGAKRTLAWLERGAVRGTASAEVARALAADPPAEAAKP